jgi:hypothetical protein
VLTGPQRKFCAAYAIDRNGTAAYMAAYPDVKRVTARTEASKLLTKPYIKAEIERIRAKVEEKAQMTRDEAIAMCVEILRAAPAAAGMDNPLCELKMSKAGPFAAFPDKRGVMERLAKMLGWDEPERHQLEIEVIIGGNADSQSDD